MRILVTGTSGHVGGAIARRLIQSGHDVAGVSRRRSGIEGIAGDYSIDLGTPHAADAICAEIPTCAAIIHAAANLSMDLLSPATPLTNCLGTEQVLEVVETWQSKVFVFISSVPVIGRPMHHPIDESHPTMPQTAYHASKLYGEHLTRLAARPDRRTVILRLPAPVGPHMARNRILPLFVAAAVGGEPLRINGEGTRRQNYVDERDIAVAAQACLEREVSGTFIIGGERAISNLELANLCIKVLGSRSTIEFTSAPDPEEGVDWTLNLARARAELGYTPQVSLEETLLTLAEVVTADPSEPA